MSSTTLPPTSAKSMLRQPTIIVVVIIAIVAGLVGSAQPTGTAGADLLWRGLVALGFGLGLGNIPAKAQRLALLALLPVVSIPNGGAALIIALVTSFMGDRTSSGWNSSSEGDADNGQSCAQQWSKPHCYQNAGMVICAVSALFNLDDRWVAGSAGIASAASLAVVTGASIFGFSQSSRRRLARFIAVPVAAYAVIGAFYGIQMKGHANELTATVEQFSANPDTIDPGALAEQLSQASTTAHRWYYRPLDLVPAGAQNVRTARTLLAATDNIANAGTLVSISSEASKGNGDQPATELSQSAIDACSGINSIVGQIDSPQSGLLLPQVRRTFDKLEERPDLIKLITYMCPVAPHMATLAGFNGDRSYLVLFATTAESRGTIGLVANWAKLSASNGSISLEGSGRSVPMNDLLVSQNATVELPPESENLWGRFELAKYFQDITVSPSAAVVADAADDLFTQAYPGSSNDGVLIIGPKAIASIVGLCSGVGAGDFELESSTTVDFLTRDQYAIDVTYGERVELLQTILDSLFAKIGSGDCGASSDGTSGILSAVLAGEIVYVPTNEQMRSDFASTPIAGDLPSAEKGPLFGVIEQNAGLDKLDAYLVRDTVLSWSNHNSTKPRLHLRYTNSAPEELPEYVLGLDHGSAPPRVNRRRISIYAPTGVSSVSFGIAGQERQSTDFSEGSEAGHIVSTFIVDVEPGKPTDVFVEFEHWKAPTNPLTLLRPPALKDGSLRVTLGRDERNSDPGQRITKIDFD